MTEPIAALEDEMLEQLSRFAEGTDLEQTDDLTKFFLGAAMDAVRNYCGWHVFPVRTDILKLDGPGGSELILPTLRVVDVVSIIEDGRTLTPDTEYEWSEKGMVRSWSWTCRYRGIVATIKHGYENPQDLIGTIYSIATRAASSPAGATVDTAGPFTLAFAQMTPGAGGGLGVMEHEKAIIDHYRRPGL